MDFAYRLYSNIDNLSTFIEKNRGYLLLKGLINHLNAKTLQQVRKKLKENRNSYSPEYSNNKTSEKNNNIKDLTLLLDYRLSIIK